MLISKIIFPHRPRAAPFRYPLGMEACGGRSLKLKEGTAAVVEAVPVSAPEVSLGCGLKGPDRPSIRLTRGGMSPGLGLPLT